MARSHGRFAGSRRRSQSADRGFLSAAGFASRLLPSVALAIALAAAVAHAQESSPSPPGTEAGHANAAVTPAAPAAPPTAAPTAPAPAAAAPAAAGASEPADIHDLAAWLQYKSRNHVSALPREARLFHRLGVLAAESGQREDAVRLVRGASDLDPQFIAPHLTPASWTLFSEPSQALLQYATVLELARQNFVVQAALAANLLYLALQALFLGLVAVALMITVIRVNVLRHPWEERLALWLSPETARWWSWGLVVVPYLMGFGPVLPTLLFLGLLWPHLKARERVVVVMLAAATAATPWTIAALDRFSAPLDENRAPMWGVPLLEHELWSAGQQQRLEQLAAHDPSNPYVQFALAWSQRRGGQIAAAEASYRNALRIWPNDDRTLTNLGNTLAMQGRSEDALNCYLQAVKLEPRNAAAYFNASQIYTQRFEYRPATDALARASALDFDMVKLYQAQASQDGTLAVVDQWISPRSFWLATSSLRSTGPLERSLPPMWRQRIETIGWPFSGAALLMLALGIAFGIWEQRATPLRNCSNCGVVICRRCASRRREVALCPSCAAVESRAESPDFARVLLQQHKRRFDGRARALRTAVATLIPGYGLLTFQRVFTPIALLSLCAALLSGATGLTPPFSYEPRLSVSDPGLPIPLVLGLWLFVYAVSMLGYWRLESKARAQAAELTAPVRSRAVQATRHQPPAAAA
jgi:tetratricopeptide (TPR) repeat protein